MSLILRSLVVMLLATFLPVIHAASISLLIGDLIQPLPVADYPIPEMVTSSPSPECEGVNGGSRLCCESTFNGDVPLIKELAPIIGFKLNRNSVNGIYCEFVFYSLLAGPRLFTCRVVFIFDFHQYDVGLHMLIFIFLGEKDEECAVGTDLCCQVDSFPKVSFYNSQTQQSIQEN